jgi:hypothetical protein
MSCIWSNSLDMPAEFWASGRMGKKENQLLDMYYRPSNGR